MAQQQSQPSPAPCQGSRPGNICFTSLLETASREPESECAALMGPSTPFDTICRQETMAQDGEMLVQVVQEPLFILVTGYSSL